MTDETRTMLDNIDRLTFPDEATRAEWKALSASIKRLNERLEKWKVSNENVE